MEFVDYDIDISSLRVARSSSVRDDYGPNIVSSFPLPFSQVMGGRKPMSSAQVFRLPDEILSLILRLVDDDSLSSLALADSNFRQLARSRQFCSVIFDYSPLKWELLLHLAEEGSAAKKAIFSPRIGSCIRQFTVATTGNWFNHVSQLDDPRARKKPQVCGIVPVAEHISKLASAKRMYSKALNTLGFVFTNSLPHLALLDWKDKVELPEGIYRHLLRSRIEHLKLCHVRVKEGSTTNFLGTIKATNIRALHLELDPLTCNDKSEMLNSTFSSSLIRLCAPKLEILNWSTVYWESPGSLVMDAPTVPKFPNLRILDVRHLPTLDGASLEGFLRAPISNLALYVGIVSTIGDTLCRRGCISTLKNLVWAAFWMQPETEKLFSFLSDNPQIKKLKLDYPNHTTSLDERLLRLLSSRLLGLTSLEMSWDSTPDLSEAVLSQLTRLKSLEQLHLRLSSKARRFDHWPINHDRLRNCLRELPNLKKVAFDGDSYPGDQSDSSNVHGYYYNMILNAERAAAMFEDDPEFSEMDPWEARKILWERQHEKLMLKQAAKYVELMPNLEWVYFGGLRMEVVRDGAGRKTVRPVDKRGRASLFKIMRETFEWEGVAPQIHTL